jgi:hypothetical protein
MYRFSKMHDTTTPFETIYCTLMCMHTVDVVRQDIKYVKTQRGLPIKSCCQLRLSFILQFLSIDIIPHHDHTPTTLSQLQYSIMLCIITKLN